MPAFQPLTLVQPNPAEQRRRNLANAMMGQSLQYRPMRTGWEAIGNIAQAYVGAKMGQEADQALQQRQDAARETLANAMSQYSDPGAMYATGADAFYGTLASNPDTAPLAANMKMNDIMNQQAAAAESLVDEPKYIKGYDPVNNQMAWFDQANPTQPVMPAGPPITEEVDTKARSQLLKQHRDSVFKVTKNQRLIDEAFGKIEKVAGSGTAAGDMSLLFGFMKINDPNSTVREGEYATAQNAGSVPQRVIALYNSAVDGRLLSESQRNDFLNQARNIYDAQRQQTDIQIGNVLELADIDEIPRREVLGDQRLKSYRERTMAPAAQPAAPAMAAPAADAPLDDLLDFYK